MNQNREVVPLIRFREFNNNWDQLRLREICSHFQSGKGIVSQDIYMKGKYPVYGGNGLRGYSDVYTHEGLYALVGRQGALCGNVHLVDGKNYISEHAIAIQANENNDTRWLSNWLFMMNLGRLSESSAQPGLAVNRLTKLKITVPCKKEQTKIGELFQKLDRAIELQQQKVEQSERYKKAMLQKMFPQKGETEPQLRFEGFSGEWVDKYLGSVGEVNSGCGFPEKEQGGNAGTPFYKVSDMNSALNQIEMVKSNNYVTDIQINSNKWKVIDNIPSVIFAKVGAAVMLNRKRLVSHPFLIDNNMMSYSFCLDNWNAYFGKNYFDNLFMPKLAQVGALPSINGKDVKKIKVQLPSIEEQTKIGEFFQALDARIEVETKKLNHYESLKKAMLQRMFV